MILEKLELTNYRVFSGEVEIDLSPRVRYKKRKPIILFGGLNGAGKTSILTAIRLALYGKQSLGLSVSVKSYHEFLDRSIHKGKSDDKQHYEASVALTFKYSKLGEVRTYHAQRIWVRTKKGIKEKLVLMQDDIVLTDMTMEQSQGFLNELIPIGVSDLFFFDGEKIGELAEDAKGAALGDAIKKLLGLDLMEKLDEDLGHLLRDYYKEGASKKVKKQIELLEDQFEKSRNKAAEALINYEQLKPRFIQAKEEVQRIRIRLLSQGGAWAESKEKERENVSELKEERKNIKRELIESFDSEFPLSLAPKLLKKTISQLRKESKSKVSRAAHTVLGNHIENLQKEVRSEFDEKTSNSVLKMVNTEFAEIIDAANDSGLLHDISDRELGIFEAAVKNSRLLKERKVTPLGQRLARIENDIDQGGEKIARAPEDNQLVSLFEEQEKAIAEKKACEVAQDNHIKAHKKCLREAIDIARKLEKETEKLLDMQSGDRSFKNASNSRRLLKAFVEQMAKRKIKELEEEFLRSFKRLMRKGDVDLIASISPDDFSVTLKSRKGNEIDKDDLSAGEKQIYAISILEALARTSGRNLPMIIDTPLGRLDSIHRNKLINNYFPTASHQMIILSTDTEVDEKFYSDLSPNISHAFKLDYDAKLGSSNLTEGYFWRGNA
ncbi:MAG: DNA sulfur modification protein DndD [Candidatus Thiodiazotropha taylori]